MIAPISENLDQTMEMGAWHSVRSGWRPLYGRFYSEGFSIENHQFKSHQSVDWGKSFHSEALEICFNLTGTGWIQKQKQRLDFLPGTQGFYFTENARLQAERQAHEGHHFLTLEFSREFLQKHLADQESHLFPMVRRWLDEKRMGVDFGMTASIPMPHRLLAASLARPPVSDAARGICYFGKALEIISAMLFVPHEQELFCARQKRVARERVDQAKSLLQEKLEEPPSLEEIGAKIVCSIFHLSRTFSQETGMTIPQYLRSLRMEKAAALLRSGKHNVTEVALAVGYNSLSHFSKVFCDVFGKCPCAFPLAKGADSAAKQED